MSEDISKFRKKDFGTDDLFLNRWSPRALNGESLSDDDLMSLFEAARWAPSSYNSQPWRFIYATKDSDEWSSFFDLLNDFNKSWAKNASALVIVVSRKNFEYNEKFSPTHSFDTGSAWMSLALQASLKGLVAHGMGGFDHDKARIIASIPENFSVEAMIAIGTPGSISDLPDSLKESEFPKGRKSVSEIAFRGKLK